MNCVDFDRIPASVSQSEQLVENIQTLNLVNFQIAELIEIKEKLEARVAAALAHPEEGTKTYTSGKYKVTVRTGWIYSLDKKEYELIKQDMPEELNPVRTKIAYEVDKAKMRDIEHNATQRELLYVSEFITKKPAKLHISIKAGV